MDVVVVVIDPMTNTEKIENLENLLKRLYKDDGRGKKRTLSKKQYKDIYEQYLEVETGEAQSDEVEELLNDVCAALC